ncbi:MAG: flagellar assembly protein FliW [Desulfovibrionales bacterium]|nr:flagellar assembly protein FliW [Desulfovibrionales bacterium]
MDKKRQTINSRIGPLTIAPNTIIRFPRGIIGFEALRNFALVEFKPGSPFHFLQSLENSGLGMLLADPFSFLPAYEIRLTSQEERLLKARSVRDLVILVSVTVPKGDPEGTTLNLTGPICVNVQERLGLQAPQVDLTLHGQVLLRDLGEPEPQIANG